MVHVLLNPNSSLPCIPITPFELASGRECRPNVERPRMNMKKAGRPWRSLEFVVAKRFPPETLLLEVVVGGWKSSRRDGSPWRTSCAAAAASSQPPTPHLYHAKGPLACCHHCPKLLQLASTLHSQCRPSRPAPNCNQRRCGGGHSDGAQLTPPACSSIGRHI